MTDPRLPMVRDGQITGSRVVPWSWLASPVMLTTTERLKIGYPGWVLDGMEIPVN